MIDKSVLIRFSVNGKAHSVTVEPDDLLLDVLRERLGLTGTKYNCRQGECGACTVLMDGKSVNSCLVLAVSADGSELTTIEALSRDGVPDIVQESFMEADGSQCGYCTPGMVMSATALLSAHPDPTREEILEGLSGNLCRCTGYKHIVEAVELASKRLREQQP